MIYTLRIVSDEADNFIREIEIDSDATFLDLRRAICQACNYEEQGHIDSFFTCQEGWEKDREIMLLDMEADPDADPLLMDEVTLADMLDDDEGARLIFTFDMLTDRSLFMELKRMRGGHLDAPAVTRSEGDAPALMVDDLDAFDAANDALAKAGVNKHPDADPYDLGMGDFSDGYDEDDMDQFTSLDSLDDY